MSGSWWLALVFALVGAGSWLVGRRAQEDPKRRLQVVRPAWWVARLCGDPCGDGTIDLENGVRQIAGLVFLAGGPLSVLLRLPLTTQAGLMFLAYALLALPGAALVAWARWQEERAGESPGDAPGNGLSTYHPN